MIKGGAAFEKKEKKHTHTHEKNARQNIQNGWENPFYIFLIKKSRQRERVWGERRGRAG